MKSQHDRADSFESGSSFCPSSGLLGSPTSPVCVDMYNDNAMIVEVVRPSSIGVLLSAFCNLISTMATTSLLLNFITVKNVQRTTIIFLFVSNFLQSET